VFGFGMERNSLVPEREYSVQMRNAPVRPNRPDEVESRPMGKKSLLFSPFSPPRSLLPARTPPPTPTPAPPPPPAPAPPHAPTPAPPLEPTPAPPPSPSHAETGSGGSKGEGTGAGGAGTEEAEPGKGGRRPEQAGSSSTTPDFEAPAPEIEGEVDLDPGRISSQYVLIYDAARNMMLIYDAMKKLHECMSAMKKLHECYEKI
jgi:hypothetical protein